MATFALKAIKLHFLERLFDWFVWNVSIFLLLHVSEGSGCDLENHCSVACTREVYMKNDATLPHILNSTQSLRSLLCSHVCLTQPVHSLYWNGLIRLWDVAVKITGLTWTWVGRETLGFEFQSAVLPVARSTSAQARPLSHLTRFLCCCLSVGRNSSSIRNRSDQMN